MVSLKKSVRVNKTTPYTEGGEGCILAGGVLSDVGGELGTRAQCPGTDETSPVSLLYTPPRRDKEFGYIHGGYIGRG